MSMKDIEEQSEMLTEYKINRAGYDELMAFITEIDCDIIQFKLLCFMVRHLKTRLCIDSIAGVLDISKVNLKNEVTALIDKGVLVEQNDEGSVTYALSSDSEIRKYSVILAALDWSEKLNIMTYLRSYPGS
jgi:hypothetical protein